MIGFNVRFDGDKNNGAGGMYLEKIEEKKNDIPLPFEDLLIGTEPEIVTNDWSGQSATLTPEAAAVYDLIKGAEAFGEYEIVRRGLDWFREHYPKEYMILLD
jgi:hypothetical protein